MGNIRIQLIAAGVRILSDKTTLIRKPDPITELFGGLFGPAKTYDMRIAKDIDAELTRAIAATKRFNTKQKFNKIVNHI